MEGHSIDQGLDASYYQPMGKIASGMELNAIIEEEKDQVDDLDENERRMGGAFAGNAKQTRKVSWAL